MRINKLFSILLFVCLGTLGDVFADDIQEMCCEEPGLCEELRAMPNGGPGDITLEELDSMASIADEKARLKAEIKAIMLEQSRLRDQLGIYEKNADAIAKEEMLLRSVSNDLERMFPGEGSVWERADFMIEELHRLRKDQARREKESYSVPKYLLPTAFFSAVLAAVYWHLSSKIDALQPQG